MKVKLFLLFTLIILIIPSLNAQNNEKVQSDSHNTQLKIILNRYDDFYHFGKGLYKVKKDNRWGIINGEGDVVLPIQYAMINEEYELKEHYIIQTPENRVGIINQQGAVVIAPTMYNKLGIFYENDDEGWWELGFLVNNLLSMESNGKWGIVTAEGQEIVPPKYDFIRKLPNESSNNHLLDGRKEMFIIQQNNREGIITSEGEIIMAPDKYNIIENYVETSVGDFIKVHNINQGYGLIDLKGNVILLPEYNSIELYGNFAIFRTKKSYGMINLKNKMKSKLPEVLSVLNRGGYYIISCYDEIKKEEKEGVVDDNGKFIFPPFQYVYIQYLGGNLFEVNERNGNRKIVNQSGSTIVSRPYDHAFFIDGQLIIRRGENYKSINPSTGKEKIIDRSEIPSNNSHEEKCSDGVIIFWDNGKYGIKDATGKEIVPCKYDYIDEFIEGRANAKLNGNYGAIDKNGNCVIPFLFTEDVFPRLNDAKAYPFDWYIQRPTEFIYFEEGLAKKEVRRNSKGEVIKYELVSYKNASSDNKDEGEFKSKDIAESVIKEGIKDDWKESNIEIPAQFPGGQTALKKYLFNNVRYPESAQQDGRQGTVVVSFNVEVDGTLTDVRIKESVYKDLDTEAIRVVKRMPKWTPGSYNGKSVKSQVTVPVSFCLSR